MDAAIDILHQYFFEPTMMTDRSKNLIANILYGKTLNNEVKAKISVQKSTSRV